MKKSKNYFLFVVLFLIVIFAVSILLRKPAKQEQHIANQMKTSTFDKATRKVNSALINGTQAHIGVIKFTNGDPISSKMSNAILCADHIANVETIDLYMPDMGHGSEPPIVKKNIETVPSDLQEAAPEDKTFGCLTVENMQLFMPGLWQVRAFYNDGTVGMIDINLKN